MEIFCLVRESLVQKYVCKSSCTDLELWERPKKCKSVVQISRKWVPIPLAVPWRLFLLLSVIGVTSVDEASRRGCFYFFAEICGGHWASVSDGSGKCSVAVVAVPCEALRIATHFVYMMSECHFGTRAAVLSERWVMSGCQLVVFNQVHTEVSPLQLVKEGKKREKKSHLPAVQRFGGWGLKFEQTEKKKIYKWLWHVLSLNCWNIYLGNQKFISFLHSSCNRLLSLL